LKRFAELVGTSVVGREGLSELQAIAQLLDAMNVPSGCVRIEPSVVRGLAYYTGPVFEAALTFEVSDEKGLTRTFGSVAGGGRYDDLVKRFTGKDVPATGASIGLDRLLAALKALGKVDSTARDGPVVVAVMDAEKLVEYEAMAAELRASGIAAEVYLGSDGLRGQVQYADRRRSPVVVIVGSDEAARGEVTLKDMKVGMKQSDQITDRSAWRSRGRAQTSVPRASLVAAVRAIFEGDQAAAGAPAAT
jgi:histidyl-tRNA synthetase